jgi:hypothetical protein
VKAIKMQLELLESEKQIRGERHSDYLVSMNNLAASYRDCCRYVVVRGAGVFKRLN